MACGPGCCSWRTIPIGVKGVGVLFDDQGGQRDIRRDRSITGFDEFKDGRAHYVEVLAPPID